MSGKKKVGSLFEDGNKSNTGLNPSMFLIPLLTKNDDDAYFFNGWKKGWK